MSGTTAPSDHIDRSANCAVAISTYTGVATSATASAIQNAIVGGRGGERSGRATKRRRTSKPIAAIAEKKTIARAATSDGVAAVSESEGIANCGAGPGFGPTANVNAPRTG